MLSTILELLGLAALAAAAYLLGGPAATLIVAGVELLFVGWALSTDPRHVIHVHLPDRALTNRKLERDRPGTVLTSRDLASDADAGS